MGFNSPVYPAYLLSCVSSVSLSMEHDVLYKESVH